MHHHLSALRAERIYGAIEPAQLEAPAPIPFSPCGDRVVVRQNPLDPLTVSGTFERPERTSDWTAIGVVVAVGPGLRDSSGKRVPLDVRVGDQVVYDFRIGREERQVQAVCGERAVLLHEHEIAAIIEADDSERLGLLRAAMLCLNCGHPSCAECGAHITKAEAIAAPVTAPSTVCAPCRVGDFA